VDRYQRHSNLIGEADFEKIKQTRVLVAGAGGLGSTVLQLLARTGFGKIHFYDDAVLDEPDLNRQILYDTNDLGKLKTEVALEKLTAINPNIQLVAHPEKLTSQTSVPPVDLVIDCLDNFESRFVLEDQFFNKGIPIIHGGASQYFGQVTTLIPGKTLSLSELFGRDIIATDATRAKEIFPATVLNVASVQVSEAVKLVCGKTDHLLTNQILTIDLFFNTFDILPVDSGE